MSQGDQLPNEPDHRPDALPYESRSPLASTGGWINVGLKGRYVDVRFPNVCCWCLKDTEDFVPLETRTTYDAHIPLCPSCRAYWRVRRQIILTAVLAFMTALTGYHLWSIRPVTGAVVFQTLTLFAAFSFGIYLVARDKYGFPVRISMAWRYRFSGGAELKFKNPDYLKVLAPGNVRASGAPFSGSRSSPNYPLPPKHLK